MQEGKQAQEKFKTTSTVPRVARCLQLTRFQCSLVESQRNHRGGCRKLDLFRHFHALWDKFYLRERHSLWAGIRGCQLCLGFDLGWVWRGEQAFTGPGR